MKCSLLFGQICVVPGTEWVGLKAVLLPQDLAASVATSEFLINARFGACFLKNYCLHQYFAAVWKFKPKCPFQKNISNPSYFCFLSVFMCRLNGQRRKNELLLFASSFCRWSGNWAKNFSGSSWSLLRLIRRKIFANMSFRDLMYRWSGNGPWAYRFFKLGGMVCKPPYHTSLETWGLLLVFFHVWLFLFINSCCLLSFFINNLMLLYIVVWGVTSTADEVRCSESHPLQICCVVYWRCCV